MNFCRLDTYINGVFKQFQEKAYIVALLQIRTLNNAYRERSMFSIHVGQIMYHTIS